MPTKLTRREFLYCSGATALTLVLTSLARPRAAAARRASMRQGRAARSYRDWRDVYREKWTWDRVVRCSHTRANCLSACSWDVYVKDGIVWREEQASAYDHGGRAGAPDFFPRGCQKGACYSDLMHSPQRLRYPLARVGERGSGKWKRIGWDEALERIAEAVVEAAAAHGPDTVVTVPGPNFDQGPTSAAETRFAHSVGATMLDTFSGIGDMPLGLVQTWGTFLSGGTSDDWFLSDFIVIWCANPAYTRIPDMHFLTEARYAGTKITLVGPDYNATAMHADQWLSLRVQTDAALALGLAHVIVAEGLIDEDYVREQTDLPFLVRTDTGRYLRESDLKRGGRDDVFYLWDKRRERLARAPGSAGMRKPTLRLGALEPALEGRWTVRLASGARVEVETVFERLKRHLRAYDPERVAAITGVGPRQIRSLAREIAGARAALIYASVGACKHYHSDLLHRSLALVVALTGHHGKPGAGLRFGSWWGLTGFEELAQVQELPWWQRAVMRLVGRPAVRDVERMLTELSRQTTFTPVLPWLYVHAGHDEIAGRPEYHDPDNPLSVDEAMKAAIEAGWIPIHPAPGRDPKVLLVTACNPLRQWPATQRTLERLWPKFDLVVHINTQMSSTALWSDIVLPAAGFYEKQGIKYAWVFVPYLVLDDKAVEPLGEARDEWWVFGNLARRVQRLARARHLGPLPGVGGKKVELGQAYEVWSDGGRFDPDDPKSAMDYIFERSEICSGTTWERAIERGVVPIRRNGVYASLNNVCTDVDFERPTYPNAWQVEGKESWPTLTGRQQFYLDHPWYLAAGEALPVHKEPPAIGGRYPIRLTGGHTRWSIHTIWRCQRHMLQLQRGEPVLYINPEDARRRGIGDGSRVRVRNDIGSFECLAKPSPAVQPGQAIIYHAWENFQFAGHRGQQEPIAATFKALHLVGDYGQLHYRALYAGPNFGPRGMAVEVEPVRPA
ncbi:MAG: hypothetical protein D6815_07620 [Candidatus Dadabacteria bacterium]|nr:MAG: hypothetical protein D6815_07620 [Candidatus Dadabacteria bacterium]